MFLLYLIHNHRIVLFPKFIDKNTKQVSLPVELNQGNEPEKELLQLELLDQKDLKLNNNKIQLDGLILTHCPHTYI